MSNTYESSSDASKEYRWKQDGTDGLRSYSYASSNPDWNYAIITNPDKAKNEAYTFSDSSTGQPFARRGNLYNWTAATLGSGLDLSTDGDEAQDSVCPYGWQLPNYNSNMSFRALVNTYDITNSVAGANQMKEWPLEYLPNGLYSDGYASGRTADGYWWSSVAYSAIYGYNLRSYPGFIDAQAYWSKGHGLALRCAAFRQSLYDYAIRYI